MPVSERAAHLSAEVFSAVTRELYSAYVLINATYFKERLVPPLILIVASDSRLGRWIPELRTIEIAEKLILQHPWGAVVEVLKHEMVHQYVHETLSQHDETAHGPTFRSVCDRLGVDAAAAGVPKSGERDEVEGRVLQKIARLLALAQSSNQHEAEAAMNAAQRLMLKYNLELGGHKLGYSFRHLGQPKGRIFEYESRVASILGRYFFVEVIWVRAYLVAQARHGQVLEICGTPANLDMAEYVYTFLLQTAERLWAEHKKQHRIRGNRDRRSYMAGVMQGFADKLGEQKRTLKSEGLVWAGDADLKGYMGKRYPHVRNKSYGGNAPTEAQLHGREAGRSIVIHRPVETRSGGGGRLLSG